MKTNRNKRQRTSGTDRHTLPILSWLNWQSLGAKLHIDYVEDYVYYLLKSILANLIINIYKMLDKKNVFKNHS